MARPFLVLLMAAMHCAAAVPAPELQALQDLFGATGGPAGGWAQSSGWGTATDPCGSPGWFGVFCEGTGSVTQLYVAVVEGSAGRLGTGA
jgi:hypothetical protein